MMKPKNHKAVNRGYLLFSGYLAACVIVGVLSYFFYLRTLASEVDRIVDKTQEYYETYDRQQALVERIDLLYRYIKSLDDNGENYGLLRNRVSEYKQEITWSLDNMSNRDAKMHKKLMNDVDIFLAIKDSISIAQKDVERIKDRLDLCIKENNEQIKKLKKKRNKPM